MLGKCLGVLLSGRTPKKNDYRYLLDNLHGKLSVWKSSRLSFARRLTLVKSVVQVIPTYTMMTTMVPKVCINDIHKM